MILPRYELQNGEDILVANFRDLIGRLTMRFFSSITERPGLFKPLCDSGFRTFDEE